MVEIAIGGRGQLESAEADVVKGLVVDTVGLVSILHQLMNRKCGIVRFNNCVGYFRRWDDGESVHDAVRVFFANFGN